ncbi:acyl-CoA dehydrogenase family protein [Polymorphospora lycopeni]|uniref:Acyl-CoA dehydrogenase family protein n=1 Tax=Polymorphospora lycopeni TaxID=3140240 RepID=A0ABV5CTX4_9ACTN
MEELHQLIGRICLDHDNDEDGLWRTLTETGLDRAGIPERFGGTGGDPADALAVAAALAEHGAATPVADQSVLAGWLAARAGIRLPAGLVVVAGDADLRSENGRIHGTARRVPWASRAGHLLVPMATAPDRTAVALVRVEQVRVRPGRNLADEPRDDVEFVAVVPDESRTVAVPAHDILLHRAALVRAVQIAGSLRAVLRMTLRYSTDRVQFGRRLSQLDVVRQQVALMAGEVAATSAAVGAAIDQLLLADDTGATRFAVAAAKVQAGTAATAVARAAHQVHGAIGVTREYPLHRHTRRLWAWRDESGGEEFWARRLSALVHGADRPLWETLVG